jgi:uncharacterized protein YebE (UPF0316 family)
MAVLAVVCVGLWTLRVALAARGRRIAGAGVAAAEAVIFALVFSNLVGNLGSWDRIAGYGVGVAVGTVVGLVANDRLNPGGAVVEVVVPGDGSELRQAFHSRGWPATSMPADGFNGAVTLMFLVVRTRRTSEVLDLIRVTAPDAFWTVRPATAVHGSPGMATSVSL